MASLEIFQLHADSQTPPVTSARPHGRTPNTQGVTADEAGLVALGYKQEFKREFSLWTTFCLSFAVLGLLPSFASTLYYGMGYAGTGGMVWGWLISWVFIECVALGMAELCSSMPTRLVSPARETIDIADLKCSGGLYCKTVPRPRLQLVTTRLLLFLIETTSSKCILTDSADASAVLAPPGYGPFAAWITGWSNWCCQVTGAPSVDYALSAMILAAASIANPAYIPTDYQTFLLAVFLMLIHACISSMPTKWIAVFNSWGSTFNLAALFVVIITILASVTGTATSPKFSPSSQVWRLQNGTEWPDGVSVLMSFIAIIWTMSGFGLSF